MVSFLLSVNKLDEIQLLLHGLGLGYLTDIMTVSALSRACFINNLRCNVPNASFSVLMRLGERHHLEPPAEHGKGGPRKGNRWTPQGGTSGHVIPENAL